MSRFEDIVGLAVVGTARQDPAAVQPPGELAGLELPETRPEQRLLHLAAALDLAHRAGRRVPAGTAPPPPAAADRLPPCSAGAAALLSQLLADDSRPLLRYWLMLAAARGHRAPAALLPELLARSCKDALLVREVAPVLDARGAWLCALNPAWKPALGFAPAAPDATAWQEGTPEQREAALRAAVRSDRALAWQWLEQSWPADAAKLRERWLGCFSPAQAADEAPLEARLDDRAEGVRAAAQRLLLQIPGSQLRTRAVQRAAACLKYKRKLLGGATLEVTPPAAHDPSWLRDGIAAKAPQGVGERAWWLGEILARAAPSDLAAQLGTDVAGLLRLMQEGDWAETAAKAVVSAAVQCRDQAALRLLLPGLLATAQAEPLRHCIAAVGTAAADEALAAALPKLPADGHGFGAIELVLAERAAAHYPQHLAAALGEFIERALNAPDHSPHSNLYWLRQIPAHALAWLSDADAAALRRRWLAALPPPDPLRDATPRETARRNLLDFLERRIAIAAAFPPAVGDSA
ncbi:MAG TPA: DUF5691 domain-containing protein [Nevskia sp.]|nr:DUF5691 domain-containing protein [Nevskia sp.]